MAKIIKLIIAIIVVLLLCVGGFVYYNSNYKTSTQTKPDLNQASNNINKSKDSTNDNKKDKKDEQKKTEKASTQTNSKPLTDNSISNNNASNKVQAAPVSANKASNTNSNSTNSNNSVNTNTVNNNKNNKNPNSSNNSTSNANNSAELSSLKTQCESAFSSIENQVNQINNEPSTNSYQATEQQNHIYNLWNNQLNYMYEKLETILPHSTFETLNNSEVNWINYKTNESSKYSDVDEEGAGAMRYYYKDAQLTKERCYYLYNNYIK